MKVETTPEKIPFFDGNLARRLMGEISSWGNVTTIILHGGSVFEFKGPFPEGYLAEGYYNLKGTHGFEGHINIEAIRHIQLLSRTHRGRESHAFVFLDKEEKTIFKIFLGRDEEGYIHSEQLEKFKSMQASGSF